MNTKPLSEPQPPAGAAQRKGNWKIPLLFGAVLLAYVAISLCSIHAPFFPGDDMGEIYFVRSSASCWSLLGPDFFNFFRPVKNLLFLFYDRMNAHGGMAAARVLPIMIGAASAWAVFGLCMRLLSSRVWGLLAMAIWLLSPTLVSCTAWLSCTNILLMVGLAAAAVICHDLAGASEEIQMAPTERAKGYWSPLAALCFLFALASYEGAVSVAALFVATDWYLHPERLRRFSTWRNYVLYGLVALFYLVLRHQFACVQHLLESFSGVTPLQAAMTSGYFTVLHGGTWFWPLGRMAAIGGYYWGQVPVTELVASALLVLAMLVLALVGRRRYPVAALGILWFLLAFAPTSNVLGFRNGPYGDYYLALPSIGLAITLAAVLRGLRPMSRTRTLRLAAVALAALLIVSRLAAAVEAVTWSYTWNKPLEVYTRNLHTFPQAFNAMIVLGKMRLGRAEFGAADDLAAAAIKIAPERQDAYAIRAVVAEQEGRIPEALNWLAVYRKCVGPDAWASDFEAYLCEKHLGQPERAESLYREAIAKRPWSEDSIKGANDLAYLLATRSRHAEAAALWEELLTYQPNEWVLHRNLAIAYTQLGDTKRAAYHDQRAQAMAAHVPPSPP